MGRSRARNRKGFVFSAHTETTASTVKLEKKNAAHEQVVPGEKANIKRDSRRDVGGPEESQECCRQTGHAALLSKGPECPSKGDGGMAFGGKRAAFEMRTQHTHRQALRSRSGRRNKGRAKDRTNRKGPATLQHFREHKVFLGLPFSSGSPSDRFCTILFFLLFVSSFFARFEQYFQGLKPREKGIETRLLSDSVFVA